LAGREEAAQLESRAVVMAEPQAPKTADPLLKSFALELGDARRSRAEKIF
jgi:hypothetical protein